MQIKKNMMSFFESLQEEMDNEMGNNNNGVYKQ